MQVRFGTNSRTLEGATAAAIVSTLAPCSNSCVPKSSMSIVNSKLITLGAYPSKTRSIKGVRKPVHVSENCRRRRSRRRPIQLPTVNRFFIWICQYILITTWLQQTIASSRNWKHLGSSSSPATVTSSVGHGIHIDRLTKQIIRFNLPTRGARNHRPHRK